MTTEIMIVDPKEYGLESKRASQISKMFKPMLDKMVELEKEHNQIAKKAKKEINKEVCKEAHVLRMEFVKVRTGTGKIHKEAKAEAIAIGRFIDGWKNTQKIAGEKLEENLKNIENHFENIENERITKLQESRGSQVAIYVDSPMEIPGNLGEMEEQVFQNYLIGVKASQQARKEAEAKAEAERLAQEKAEAEEKAKLEAENKRLMDELAKKETPAEDDLFSPLPKVEPNAINTSVFFHRMASENMDLAEELKLNEVASEQLKSELIDIKVNIAVNATDGTVQILGLG